MKVDLRPYDAVMVVSYGGPRKMEDVLPFMRNATSGRGVPDERLLEVSEHYKMVNGASPINARNAELVEAISNYVEPTGIPVVIGNRNWTPFVKDVLQELYDDGVRRLLCIFTAAYTCYSGCRQYREDLGGALQELGITDMVVDKVRPYATTEGFIAANADAVVQSLRELAEEGHPEAHLLLVTHSIPDPMQWGSAQGDIPDYARQHEIVGREVIARVSRQLGRHIDFDLAYCSRSGPPHQPWLEPDVNDRLEELANAGVKAVAVAPVGFINDHMEVVYDLDTEAKETAQELQLAYRRAATAGTDPRFIASVVGVLNERAARARGENPGAPEDPVEIWDHILCPPGVCVAGPDAPVLPTVCEGEGER